MWSGPQKATRLRPVEARTQRSCGVEDPRHAEKLPAREPGDPVAAVAARRAGREEKVMSHKSSVHSGGESYSGVVLAKQPNKAEESVADGFKMGNQVGWSPIHQGALAPGVDCVPQPCRLGIKQRLVLPWKTTLATKRTSNPHLARYFNKRRAGASGRFSGSRGRTKPVYRSRESSRIREDWLSVATGNGGIFGVLLPKGNRLL
jgi:hypothetical protein